MMMLKDQKAYVDTGQILFIVAYDISRKENRKPFQI